MRKLNNYLILRFETSVNQDRSKTLLDLVKYAGMFETSVNQNRSKTHQIQHFGTSKFETSVNQDRSKTMCYFKMSFMSLRPL